MEEKEEGDRRRIFSMDSVVICTRGGGGWSDGRSLTQTSASLSAEGILKEGFLDSLMNS